MSTPVTTLGISPGERDMRGGLSSFPRLGGDRPVIVITKHRGMAFPPLSRGSAHYFTIVSSQLSRVYARRAAYALFWVLRIHAQLRCEQKPLASIVGPPGPQG